MDFMSEFRPRPGTVQLHDALAIQLDQLDRRIKTSNNITGKQVAEHMMGLMLGFHQWTIAQTTDLADYTQAIAGRMEGEGNLDDEDFSVLAAVHEHLEGLQKLFEEMKGLLPPNVLALGDRNKELMTALADILDVAVEDESEGEDAPLFEDDEEPPEAPTPTEDEVTK